MKPYQEILSEVGLTPGDKWAASTILATRATEAHKLCEAIKRHMRDAAQNNTSVHWGHVNGAADAVSELEEIARCLGIKP